MSRARQRGVNLIELVIAIVVISIAATGVLLVYATAVRFSADPMVQQQALAAAEAYLDEILARPVCDPTVVAVACDTETGGPRPARPATPTTTSRTMQASATARR